MTVDEIFSQATGHMTEGLMIHAQLSHYYKFLGLEGYSQCHLYHFLSENANYINLSNYFIEYYNKLPIEKTFTNPNIIPKDWYSYTRQNVNDSIRKASIEAGFKKWIDWERNTKKLYEQYYHDLIALKEIAAAKEMCKYIKDVAYELAHAEKEELELKTIGYNISDIMEKQKSLHDIYKRKIKEIKYA